ncbi:MAG: M48 family metalloprotease [Candidatus Coproplasma sp.]
MYIFSFLKSLIKPKNLLSAIYFLINSVIIFFIFYILPIEVIADEKWNPIVLGLIGLGINAVIILISLSPIGEFFWRIRNRVFNSAPDEFAEYWQNVNAVFEEVKNTAIQCGHKISDKLKLYYTPTNDLNAFALGHRTVVITHATMCINPDYIKGVLAHEMGHIVNADSDLKLGINVSNGILTIFLTVVSFISNFIIGALTGAQNGFMNVIGLILNFLFNILIIGLFNVWNYIGVLCVNCTSRKSEYKADGFAKELGYGEQLTAFLYALDGNAPKTSIFNLMYQTHPDTPDRIRALGGTAV